MAALQTLRKKPALLMSVIGGALLLFIITMVMENQTGIMGPDMEAGEVYGEEVTIQDFESKVNQEQNFQEIARVLGSYFQTGQLNPQRLSESEKDQIRQQVWNDILSTHAVKEEAKELGLEATDGDVKNALMGSQYQETQFMMMVGSFVSGTPTINGYKQFMAGFEKQLAQIRQQQPELEDLFLSIHRASLYCEQKLQDAILMNKYASLMRHSFTANAISAQMEVNDMNTTASVELAAIPYTTIADSTVKVEDKELKAKYDIYKKMFYTPSETRMVKLIDVNVTPSISDRANLVSEVKEKEAALRTATNAEDIAAIVGDSKSTISYNNAYFPKEAYNQGLREVANAIDTMAVGAVKATQNDGQNITTFKLVGKVNTADSLLIRGIGAKDKAQADSIMTAIKAGTDFGELAVALGQKDTAFWVNNPVYVERPATADSGVYTNLCQLSVKEPAVVAEQQGYAVMEVLEKAHTTAKYNVAVVKYAIEYSDETYENALSKLNNFLANNKTIEEFEANASKEGYYIQDIPNFSSESYMGIRSIGGDQASQAVRWILDDAEAGDISNVFECGNTDRGTHLLAAAVVSISDDEYLTLENESVKEFMTALVKQDKKAERIMATIKDVKTFEDAKVADGAIADSVAQFNLAQFPQMPFIGVVEPKLAGAMAKANKGDFVNGIQGAAAVYMMQVVDKTAAQAGNVDETIMNIKGSQLGNVFGMTQGMYGQQSLNQYPMRLINELIQHEGNIVDKRYKF